MRGVRTNPDYVAGADLAGDSARDGRPTNFHCGRALPVRDGSAADERRFTLLDNQNIGLRLVQFRLT